MANHLPPCASEQALKAAKAFVAYIEFWRSHGTGECMAKYPNDDHFGGYDNIVRRARELSEAIDGFDRRSDRRKAERRAAEETIAGELREAGQALYDAIGDVEQGQHPLQNDKVIKAGTAWCAAAAKPIARRAA